MSNTFQEIDTDEDGKAPEHLKKEIMSEVDSIRNGMAVMLLYVGHFFSTAFAAISSDNSPKSNKSDSTNSIEE
jgi:hypothetical protein